MYVYKGDTYLLGWSDGDEIFEAGEAIYKFEDRTNLSADTTFGNEGGFGNANSHIIYTSGGTYTDPIS